MQLIFLIMLISLFLIPSSSQAYIGPGLGMGTIGAILGVIFSVFLAIFAVFWYPIKRMVRKYKKGNEGDNKQT